MQTSASSPNETGPSWGSPTFRPAGDLDQLYVHKAAQHQGVGSALLRAIEQKARTLGVGRVETEASITAEPFFERLSYVALRQQMVRVNGVSMANVKMVKILGR